MGADTADTGAKNVLGEPLQACCTDPMTGFFRDGHCRTHAMDHGTHVVCAVVTDAFLAYTRNRGNDLQTPRPEFDFPGFAHCTACSNCSISRNQRAGSEANMPRCAAPGYRLYTG